MIQENGWKVLLIDDEADIREVLEILLSDMGYRVLSAENGDQAFEMFCEAQPPVVLTDIKMPGMDGIALLQKIKRENPDTEVIMITGHGDMDLAIKSFQDNAVDFITKPIGIGALETALKKAEDKLRIRQQLSAYTESLETLLFEKSRQPERQKKCSPGPCPFNLQTVSPPRSWCFPPRSRKSANSRTISLHWG